MNLLLINTPDAHPGDTLEIPISRYPLRPDVWPPPVGRQLTIGIEDGLIGEAEVIDIDHQSIRITITALEQPPPAASSITLLLALPRPKMLRRIVRSCSELGIKHLHLINSYRVEKSYWQSPLLAEQNLLDFCRAGLEQACDTVLPQIRLWPRFKPFVEDHLPAITRDAQCIVAHPAATEPLKRGSPSGKQVLAVGPEGGFSDYEIKALCATGFLAQSMGARILRVETAVPVLISRLDQ